MVLSCICLEKIIWLWKKSLTFEVWILSSYLSLSRSEKDTFIKIILFLEYYFIVYVFLFSTVDIHLLERTIIFHLNQGLIESTALLSFNSGCYHHFKNFMFIGLHHAMMQALGVVNLLESRKSKSKPLKLSVNVMFK